MNETLIIYLPRSIDEDAQWVVADAIGASRTGVSTGDLVDAAQLAEGRRVVAIIGYADVIRTEANLPVSGAKLLSALPYALEEQFASDVDDLHFSAGAPDEDGTRAVAALDRAVMDSYLSRLTDAGLTAQAMYSLHDGLTPLENFTQILVGDALTVLRTPDQQISAHQGLPPSVLLSAWMAQEHDEDAATATARQTRIYFDASASDVIDADREALNALVPDAEIRELGDGLWQFAARSALAGDSINLLQGAYAVSTNHLKKLKPWLPVAAMLGGLFVLSTAVKFADMRALQKESALLDQQMVQLLAERGQPNVPLVSAEPTLLNVLGRAGANASPGAANTDGPGYLETLSKLAASVEGNADTTVEALAFRNGVFDVRLTTKDTDALEQLRKNLTQDGVLSAQIQRTEQQDGKISSFMQIKGATP
ncbi:MAG: type II secretion system protein GspL [Pseudomonadota bacterium]